MTERPPSTPRSQRPRAIHEDVGLARIQAVVDDFYDRARIHPALAETFAVVEDWPEHKAKITHFWWISLGGERYRDDRYRVAPVHIEHRVTAAQLDDWLKLFDQVLARHLEPSLARAWHERAAQMGRSIRMIADYADSAEASAAARLGKAASPRNRGQ